MPAFVLDLVSDKARPIGPDAHGLCVFSLQSSGDRSSLLLRYRWTHDWFIDDLDPIMRGVNIKTGQGFGVGGVIIRSLLVLCWYGALPGMVRQCPNHLRST